MKKIAVILLAAAVAFSVYVFVNPDIITKIKNFNIVEALNDEPDWETVQVEELSIGSPAKYYFNLLNSKEKQAYNNVLQEIDSFPDRIEVPFLDDSEVDHVFNALLNDNPYLFFIDKENFYYEYEGLKSYFKPSYTLTVSEYNSKKQQLAEKTGKIIADAGKKNQFETELFIHDAIVNNCTYKNNSTEASSIVGALINNEAACEGYSKAAKVLFDLAGIECYVVSGKTIDEQGQIENHMWNIVKISGNYYHLDLTWDDPVTIGMSSQNDPTYTYFNITDEEIKKTHSDFSSENACTSSKDNYFVVKGFYFAEYNEHVKNKIAKGIAAAANEGKNKLEIRFSSPSVYTNAINNLFSENDVYSDNNIYDILKRADRESEKDILDSRIYKKQKDDFNIIELIFEFS